MKQCLLVFSFLFILDSISQKFTSLTVDPFNKKNFIGNIIDIDNDGDDDVFGWQNNISNSTTLYRNDGNNVFTDITVSKNFSKRNNGTIADLDKNGYSDLYWINGDTLRYSFYDGSKFSSIPNTVGCGFYIISSIFNCTSSNIKSTKFGDFDNDGIYDFIAHVVNGTSSIIYGLKGVISNTSCSFSFDSKIQTLITLSNTNPVFTQFVDIDNDSDFDLLLASGTSQYSNYSYSIYLNSGKGGFTLKNNSGYTSGRINAFGICGELNNDGNPDIISGAADCCLNGSGGSNNINPLTIYFSDNKGSYSATNTAMIRATDRKYYQGASLIDINLDSKIDIVWDDLYGYANSNSSLQCYLNNGNSSFNESSSTLGINFGTASPSTTHSSQQTLIFDVNNDYKPDLNIQSYGTYDLVFYNNYLLLNTSSNNSVKLKLDACTGLREGWGARIKYLCNGVWSFQQSTGYTSSNYPFLYLGTGSAKKIDSLVVEWVGGKISSYSNISSGTYLSVSESEQCKYSPCINPSISITSEGNTTFCQKGFVKLNASSVSNYSYQWYNNGQIIIGATGSSYQAISSGQYTLKAIDGGCSGVSNSINVTVNDNPNVSINILPNIIYKTSTPIQLTGSPKGGVFTGDGITGSILYPTKLKLGTQSITYKYTTPEGCSNSAFHAVVVVDSVGNICSTYDTLKIILKLSTGINNNQFTNLYVYPNPVSNILIIDAEDIKSLTGYSYRIIDNQGKEVYNSNITLSKTEIDINKFGAKGLYILHILDTKGNSIENKKIILE